jgi:hypothetical protein
MRISCAGSPVRRPRPGAPVAIVVLSCVFALVMGGTANAQTGGTSKTCGLDSGEQGGNCFLEAAGFPGGRVVVNVDSTGTFPGSIGWRVVNLKGGGPICEGSYVPAEKNLNATCEGLPAGTLSLETARPPGETATIALSW